MFLINLRKKIMKFIFTIFFASACKYITTRFWHIHPLYLKLFFPFFQQRRRDLLTLMLRLRISSHFQNQKVAILIYSVAAVTQQAKSQFFFIDRDQEKKRKNRTILIQYNPTIFFLLLQVQTLNHMVAGKMSREQLLCSTIINLSQ